MNAKAKSLVLFVDNLEDDATPHYGILFDNGFILCFCCGGYIERETTTSLKISMDSPISTKH